ncbi:N-acetyltransferase [Alicyclobacillus sp. SO9]|uniref:GNAT family N-acetyltransferase n=1 Tax=Alicyclobacillus sp. SO9 TaxID=2665646 RepID=UPI0018E795B6|nr:GNAT family N-acetyltransferase [Alicyclobacillus sp. SO9]QQE78689.1 GNAT family N-acetyltransferase [Alicyclobacillus sp. SO9]
MLFESEYLYVDDISQTEISAVVQVYNSNRDFLVKHMRTDSVTAQCVFDELESMRKLGFTSCKVTAKDTNRIVGIIDFKVDEESYLSLLMIHTHYANRGLGKQVYEAFEEYASFRGSKQIKLDVVTSYTDKVLSFWTRNGFHKSEDISLNWNGAILPAVTMLKSL